MCRIYHNPELGWHVRLCARTKRKGVKFVLSPGTSHVFASCDPIKIIGQWTRIQASGLTKAPFRTHPKPEYTHDRFSINESTKGA